MRLTVLSLCLLASICTFAQPKPGKPALNVDQIMKGERFIGFSPENITWSEDSRQVFFSWNPNQDTLRSWYKTDLSGSSPVKASLAEQMEMNAFGSYSRDYQQRVFSRSGDLFLQDFAKNTSTQLSNTLAQESNPRFAGDQQKIVYQLDGNLFVLDLRNSSVQQLTNFRSSASPVRVERKGAENEEWLKEDQLDMFEILRWRKGQREINERNNKAMVVKRPKEFAHSGKTMSSINFSPDLRFITFRLTKRADPKATIVPSYVTESGYTEDLPARSKVGSAQDTHEMGIYDSQRDTIYMVDAKKLEGILDKPAFLQDYHKGDKPYNPKYEKAREVNFLNISFNEEGKAVVLIRSLDNKDRWIAALDLQKGSLKVLDRLRDEAWVGGPGFFSLGWIDNEHIWFQSEETGYSHLYKLNVNTGQKTALTSGKFEVLETRLSRDRKRFFLSASAEGPHERHFYHLPVAGGKMEKITSMIGGNEVTLSPDEKQLAILYSSPNQPWELYLMENRAGASAKKVTTSTTAAFQAYPWRKPEIVWFTARDGAKVPARLYKPERQAPTKPAVIFVHGAGYLQNVHQWWSSYSREYMFHNMLADQGYTVLDVDYRASAGYGRDWRTGIYRFMGGKDLDDQVDGARYLAKNHGVDPGRIGIYGGSYGGFITLMGLFTSPETFKSGAALRPVTDWAHYNHGYTANILNTPVEDSIAYQRSSPIYHAAGLKNRLLMLHGMLDVNVHFQDVVRLQQRLIELRKDNWDLAAYPMEDHGFIEPSSWADEYRRIYKLFEETLAGRTR
jgi:dipeptidyl aminopeptidase/acylaminoacyl peptidase